VNHVLAVAKMLKHVHCSMYLHCIIYYYVSQNQNVTVFILFIKNKHLV